MRLSWPGLAGIASRQSRRVAPSNAKLLNIQGVSRQSCTQVCPGGLKISPFQTEGSAHPAVTGPYTPTCQQGWFPGTFCNVSHTVCNHRCPWTSSGPHPFAPPEERPSMTALNHSSLPAVSGFKASRASRRLFTVPHSSPWTGQWVNDGDGE